MLIREESPPFFCHPFFCLQASVGYAVRDALRRVYRNVQLRFSCHPSLPAAANGGLRQAKTCSGNQLAFRSGRASNADFLVLRLFGVLKNIQYISSIGSASTASHEVKSCQPFFALDRTDFTSIRMKVTSHPTLTCERLTANASSGSIRQSYSPAIVA